MRLNDLKIGLKWGINEGLYSASKIFPILV
jgi:hypothetical protein